MNKIFILGAISLFALSACKKEGCTDETALNYNPKAKKDDNSCQYPPSTNYTVPTTYVFSDVNGNSTVDYTGQNDRLNQLSEMITLLNLGETQALSAQSLKDMFSNVGGNGNNNFSFSSTKQLKDKCFTIDQALIESYLDSAALASQSFGVNASNGQAGTLSSGSSTYLFSRNGIQYSEVFEKSVMGACFMHQALNYYFDTPQMSVDNLSAVDASSGKYYTQRAHHWDEAFGYFGVPTNFPTTSTDRFWDEYCVKQNTTLGCNDIMMGNFLKGRAAVVHNNDTKRDEAIQSIRVMWENICAEQAIFYINTAIINFGSDNAKYLHVLSETYGFVNALRYAPTSTRRMTQSEVNSLVAQFGTNFWDLTLTDLQAIRATLISHY